VYEYRGSMLEDQYMFDLLFDEYPEGRMEVLEEGDEDEEDAERRLLSSSVFPTIFRMSSAVGKSLPLMSANLSVLQSRIRGMLLGGIIGDCFGTRFNDVGVDALPMVEVAESISYRALAPSLAKLSAGKWLFRLSCNGYMMLEATKNALDGGDSATLRRTFVDLINDPDMNHLKWGAGLGSVLSGEAPKSSTLRGNTVMIRSLPAALFPDSEYERIFQMLADAVPVHEVAKGKAKMLTDSARSALKSGIFDPTGIKDIATASALQLATPANYDEISMNEQ
ncbi:ADP-ribose glycohydrolase ARH3, partial [Perkinsus olseni]